MFIWAAVGGVVPETGYAYVNCAMCSPFFPMSGELY